MMDKKLTTKARRKADGSIGLKARAVKEHTPAAELDAKAVMAVFQGQQRELLILLERARRVDMQKLRVPISIARFILGDNPRDGGGPNKDKVNGWFQESLDFRGMSL